jgi:hypothetical protein
VRTFFKFILSLDYLLGFQSQFAERPYGTCNLRFCVDHRFSYPVSPVELLLLTYLNWK